MMKISRLKTAWIISTLFFCMGKESLRTIFKCFFSTPTRPWIDKTIHHWMDQLLNAVQVHYKVINPLNTQPEPGQATILMCNHSSLYDIPLAFKAFPNNSIRMLSKKELSKVPLFGKALSKGEFPFINRKNRYEAINDLKYMEELMRSGIIIWVAPEGTRSKDGKLAPFKKGAFITAIHAKATIIPIGIRGAFDILPARTFRVNLQQEAEIHIGKPIDASQFSIENKDLLVKETFDAIQKLIGEKDS